MGVVNRMDPQDMHVKTPEVVCPELPGWLMHWSGRDKDVSCCQGWGATMPPFSSVSTADRPTLERWQAAPYDEKGAVL
jgi:hypothetical protein